MARWQVNYINLIQSTATSKENTNWVANKELVNLYGLMELFMRVNSKAII